MAYESGSVTYKNGLPLAGKLVSMELTAAADEYYVGMPLTFNGTNSNYEYSATGIQAVCLEEKELSAEGSLLCGIMGTEFQESALVDGDNASLSLTDAARNAAMLNGVILR